MGRCRPSAISKHGRSEAPWDSARRSKRPYLVLAQLQAGGGTPARRRGSRASRGWRGAGSGRGPFGLRAATLPEVGVFKTPARGPGAGFSSNCAAFLRQPNKGQLPAVVPLPRARLSARKGSTSHNTHGLTARNQARANRPLQAERPFFRFDLNPQPSSPQRHQWQVLWLGPMIAFVFSFVSASDSNSCSTVDTRSNFILSFLS